jgi:tRNA ligase
MSIPKTRLTASEQSSINKLMYQLYHFGQKKDKSSESLPDHDNEEEGEDFKDEEEDFAVGDGKGSKKVEDPSKVTNKRNQTEYDQKLAKLARRTVYSVAHHLADLADQEEYHHELTSWKFAEWAYKWDPCPFPCLARGLFTEKVIKVGEDTDSEEKLASVKLDDDEDERWEGDWRIVIRGYDKFFNVGEVAWTKARLKNRSLVMSTLTS